MSMTAKEALKILTGAEIMVLNRMHDKFMDAACVALECLREKVDRENPKPLTIEQLRQMDGEPVWVADLREPDQSGCCVIYADKVSLPIYGDKYCTAAIPGIENTWYAFNTYEKEWLAYRHKPKEEHHED